MNLFDYIGGVALVLYVAGWLLALGGRFMEKQEKKQGGIIKRSSDD